MDTILFDLDGTLLPLDQEEFIRTYFSKLCKRAAPLGLEKEKLVSSLWIGTGEMIKNDGSMPNRDRFWNRFAEIWGEDVRNHESVFDDFYQREFDETKSILGDASGRRELIDALKEKGYTLVLATNPIFPAVAVKTRLTWIGLVPEDFTYITSYENSRFCKPTTEYYKEILQKIKKTPEDCMMIGNNTSDDMAAIKLGIRSYLVTDYLENEPKADVNSFEHGTISDMIAYLKDFPAV